MSGAAKFLLTTIGGGVLLGTAGGYLADPKMQQYGGNEPWRQMLESDRSPSESPLAIEAPPYDLRPYGGSHSYAPEFADDPIETWSDPYLDADWLEYEPDWPEPPQIARLEIEEPEAPSYGRTVEFPPPSITRTAERAERAADDASLAASEPADLPPEPRVAQGALPAIW
ncbi:hypothetical protein GRI75_10025 [Altererythrobacter soli]|uniref:Uncharacterized protein n=1 Tax=Croceibacterium soli TaxID=1739690 RepID=A0A6I4UU04_9SPHN|nr:hypothetical protein [Croceibacterium soli]MXP41976.1 hypothetical protein [Croceibacterium soli]